MFTSLIFGIHMKVVVIIQSGSFTLYYREAQTEQIWVLVYKSCWQLSFHKQITNLHVIIRTTMTRQYFSYHQHKLFYLLQTAINSLRNFMVNHIFTWTLNWMWTRVIKQARIITNQMLMLNWFTHFLKIFIQIVLETMVNSASYWANLILQSMILFTWNTTRH